MTSATPVQLSQYRTCRRIVPVRDYFEDIGQFIFRCEHDHLRIHQERGRWRHDASEIANLAARERGEPIAW